MPQRSNPELPEYAALHALQEIAARNDERITMLMEHKDDLEAKIEQLQDDNKELKDELQKVKNGLEALIQRVDKIDGIWDKIFDNLWKIILMVIAGAILYYLGLQSPPG
jgi:predicted nuclease with TOPRIM domain